MGAIWDSHMLRISQILWNMLEFVPIVDAGVAFQRMAKSPYPADGPPGKVNLSLGKPEWFIWDATGGSV